MKAGVLKSTGRGKVVTPIFIPQLKSLIGLINPTMFGSNHIILPSLGHSAGFHMLQGLDRLPGWGLEPQSWAGLGQTAAFLDSVFFSAES